MNLVTRQSPFKATKVVTWNLRSSGASTTTSFDVNYLIGRNAI